MINATVDGFIIIFYNTFQSNQYKAIVNNNA